ncbi:ACP S-malonyltransferase [Ruminiclostridium cellulolyticum]|uniref:[acyl-carrier-protein] S-malonyltransferase n=1 Tax=Ruminiclostridium cellulolyticum (strain ATCC 35319 / DSM 5812 / JCM 6584 / H10) TaxID=394503 RepID=B8I977_RUMCH|nr:ACP S-malonyltransferase [Ruminiclostridium cellulolyticum]ACL75337.1 Acyl transferase [Ruminiclostridium cellulolyticum H10]
MERVALLFPGQGSQYAGMGKSLYDEFKAARLTFEEANDVLKFDIKRLCFDGLLSDLSKPENIQLTLLTVSVATFRAYMEQVGMNPVIAAGHSLGEYSALTCSGAVSFPDMLKIVNVRSKLSQELADSGLGGMTIIDGLDPDVVEECCSLVSRQGHIVTVSCYNSATQTAISGHQNAVMEAEDKLIELGAQITPIIGSAPFHSAVMETAGERLKEELGKYTFRSFNFPVISNFTALPYEKPNRLPELLQHQMSHPVQWQRIMNYLKYKGIKITIEIGPQNVLRNLVKSSINGIEAFSFGQQEDRDRIIKDERFSKRKESIGEQGSEFISMCLAMAVSTKNRNDNVTEYNKGVIEPYERIAGLQQRFKKDGTQPKIEQMYQAVEMLQTVLLTKKIDLSMQKMIFNNIFDQTGTHNLFRDLICFQPNESQEG